MDNRKKAPPMVEIKRAIIGDIFILRCYQNIRDYEKEIIERFNNGESLKI